jgi:hypothetical protein
MGEIRQTKKFRQITFEDEAQKKRPTPDSLFRLLNRNLPASIFYPGAKVIFFRWATPSHDDCGKTIDDIEKRFFAFNCQLKKLNREKIFRTSFDFFRTNFILKIPI